MAQLIKLNDYISRYSWDVYRYPTQYIRLKKENWNKLLDEWENAKGEKFLWDLQKQEVEEEAPKRLFTWDLFKRNKDKDKEEEEDLPLFNAYLARMDEEELKHYFLNQLYPLQLKWATSTVTQVSFVDKKYERHERLKHLLQSLPDTYLILYKPMLTVKNAAIDCDTIFITPIGIEIVHYLEFHESKQIVVGNDRSWNIQENNETTPFLSPLFSLRRTEQIIRSIFKKHDFSFPIQKTVLSRHNQMIYWQEPYQVDIVDTNDYANWLEERQQLSSPLKADQLKAASLLLDYTKTVAVRRPEWQEESSTVDFDVDS